MNTCEITMTDINLYLDRADEVIRDLEKSYMYNVEYNSIANIIDFIHDFDYNYADIFRQFTKFDKNGLHFSYAAKILTGSYNKKGITAFNVVVDFDTAFSKDEIIDNLLNLRDKDSNMYEVVKFGFYTLVKLVRDKLKEIKVELENAELEKMDNKIIKYTNKDNLVRILLDNTIGENSLNYDINYLRDWYYILTAVAKDAYNTTNSIVLDFKGIINYRLLSEYLFGKLNDCLPSNIHIYLQDDCRDRIGVSNSFGCIFYSIKDIDKMTNDSKFESERILLKNIIILLLLKLIGKLDK